MHSLGGDKPENQPSSRVSVSFSINIFASLPQEQISHPREKIALPRVMGKKRPW
jgi:hypothetical protein